MENSSFLEEFNNLQSIDEEWIDENPGELDPVERRFAQLLLSKASLILFRGPNLNGSNPDFVVYNQQAQRGKVVEVSLMFGSPEEYKERGIPLPTSKTLERKERQKAAIKNSGLPHSFIYRGNLEKIRSYQAPGLF